MVGCGGGSSSDRGETPTAVKYYILYSIISICKNTRGK